MMSSTMLEASNSSKSQAMRRRINKERLSEFSRILEKSFSPFEAHKFCCHVCSVACGQPIEEGHPFASALTPAFAAAYVEAVSTQSMDPIVEAVYNAVSQFDSFSDFVYAHPVAFHCDETAAHDEDHHNEDAANKKVAKEKLVSALVRVIQEGAASNEAAASPTGSLRRSIDSAHSSNGLTPFDEMVVEFFVEKAFRKGLFFGEDENENQVGVVDAGKK